MIVIIVYAQRPKFGLSGKHCKRNDFIIVATFEMKNASIQQFLHGHNQVNFIQQKFCDTFNAEIITICV